MKIKIREEVKLLLLFALSVFSSLPLPFQLGSMCYYLLFFYLGSYIWNNKNKIIDKFASAKYLIIGWIVFLILFISLTLFREKIQVIGSVAIYEKY